MRYRLPILAVLLLAPLAALQAIEPFPGVKTDKTLVSWVILDNTTQQGGSALTIQQGDQFDGIVFGERVSGKWMAGSNFFARTQGDQRASAVESAGPDTLVQLAIVYEREDVRIYRNGQPYASYKTQNVDLLGVENHIAVFGLRHVGAGTGTALAGSIEDARIYGRALSVHEIQSLRPNEPSDIKPLAWWDFEGEALKDRAGHFTHHALFGGAKLRGGRLVLDGTGYLVAARSEAAAKQAVLKTADGKTPNIRHWDPDCWLMNDTYYAYSGGGNPQLMKSTDLKNWTFLGDLLHPDFPSNLGASKGEDISCGNMFKIGDKWMLLCINHGRGARYYLGDFKDEKYLPSFHAMMSFGSNQFFAPESVLTHDGRRVMWAWLLNMPIEPTGVQSLPRELELPADGVLRIRPLRELESLRYDRKQEEGITVTSDTVHRLKEVGSDALELEMVVKSPVAKEFGMDVLCDKNGENGLRLAVMAESKTLKVGNAPAPFELKKGEDLTLRVFIDKNLVEVFANDRQAVVAAGKYVPENLAVTLFSHGGDILVKQVKCWKMKSIH